MPAEAQEYLELVQTAPFECVGPYRFFRDPAADASRLRELAPRIVSAVKRLDKCTYSVPSPWHAAAWLLDLAGMIGQGLTATTDGQRSPFDPKRGTPIFRGQRDSSWDLRPSLMRRPHASNSLALELVIDAVSETFKYEENLANTRYANMAAAQHYGLSTPLLDFTADPRIAVYFACDRARDGDEAAVYFTPLNPLHELGAAVILPPPWVRRLYAQRGLFIDCTRLPEGGDLRDLCCRMIFPADVGYAASYLKHGRPELLSPEPWFEKAVHWARKSVETSDPFLWKKSPAAALKDEIGAAPFQWDALSPTAMMESQRQFVEMCGWLALKIVDGTPVYDLTTIDLIKADNPAIFLDMRNAWRYVAKTLGFPWPGEGTQRFRPRSELSPDLRYMQLLMQTMRAVEMSYR